jgi:transposase-like protein
MSQRRKFTSEFKAKVALEAIRESNTLAEIAQKHKLQATQVSAWKKEALDSMSEIFKDKRRINDEIKDIETKNDELYKVVGQLTMERNWLKKKSKELGL